MDFENSLNKLEEILKQLEDGNLPLEKTLVLYKEGAALSEKCQAQLDNAKLQISEKAVESNDQAL